MAVKVYLNTAGNAVIVDDGVSQVNVIRVDSFFYEKDEVKDFVTIRDTDDDYTKRVPAGEVTDEAGTPYGTIDDVSDFFDTIFTASTVVPLPAGAATEIKQDSQISIMTSILNNMIASQDVEILLVRDTGAVPVEIVQQIREYDQGTGVWTTRYEDVNGAAYVPVGPLEYLDASAVLNLLLTEALDQGLTLDAIQVEQLAQGLSLDSIVTNTTGLATQLTLNDLLTAFNAEDFAQEVTSQLINSNIVLGNLTLNGIKSQTDLLNFIATALEVNVTSSALPTGAATEVTLNNLLTAFNAENFATETTLADLNTKLNTLGQKASAASAPVVLSTEQEVILDAIKTAVENIDSDLGTGGLALETTQQAIETLITSTNALLTTIDADTSNLDVLLSTRAADASVLATNALLTTIDGVLDAIKVDTGALVVDVAAIEVLITNTNALLTTIDGVLDAIKLDTANLDVALSSRLNTLGRKPETASAPVVLSDEDFASLEAIRVAVQNLDVDVDGIATEVTLAALLTAFNNEDFASQTTLAAILACLCTDETSIQSILSGLRTDFNAEDFATQTTLQALLTAFNAEDFATQTTLAALLTAFNATDFATETTLNAIKLQTDQMSFDGNSALEVSLPTGVVASRYERLAGIGSYTVFAGNTKVSILNYGSVPVTVDNGLGPVQLDPGIGLDFAAPEGKTLGAITTASTSASGLVAITQVGN